MGGTEYLNIPEYINQLVNPHETATTSGASAYPNRPATASTVGGTVNQPVQPQYPMMPVLPASYSTLATQPVAPMASQFGGTTVPGEIQINTGFNPVIPLNTSLVKG